MESSQVLLPLIRFGLISEDINIAVPLQTNSWKRASVLAKPMRDKGQALLLKQLFMQ